MALDRRDLLTIGGLIVAGTALGSVGSALSHTAGGHGHDEDDGHKTEPAVKRAGDRASSKNKWGMVIDIDKCGEGCDVCVRACRKENNVPSFDDPKLDIHWIRKITFKQKGVPGAQERQMPAMCFHCEHPPCAHVCPVAATFKRADGIVLVDKHRCIGCRYCMIACPYKARSFVSMHVEPKPGDNQDVPVRMHGVVEKCNLCVHRIDSGMEPACVESCSKEGNGAMMFGDFNDRASKVSQMVRTSRARRIRPDLGCDPQVFYMGI